MADQKPGTVTINATSKATGRSLETQVNVGADLDDAVRLFTKDVVYSIFKAKAVIIFQDNGRRVLANKDKTVEEAIAAVQAYKPGVQRTRAGGPRKSVAQKLDERIASGKATKDELLALAEKIKAALAASK